MSIPLRTDHTSRPGGLDCTSVVEGDWVASSSRKSMPLGLSCVDVVVAVASASTNPFACAELHVTKSRTARAAFRLVFPTRLHKRSKSAFFLSLGKPGGVVSHSSEPVLHELPSDMSSNTGGSRSWACHLWTRKTKSSNSEGKPLSG